jgi:hypothetical protein
VILAALIGTLVAAATTLSGTPARYGFDWDLLAVTPYGDQTREGLEAAFADRADVIAAAGFSSWGVLLNDRGFPALAVTPIEGTLGPTILDGRGLRADDDIVLGRDTLEQLGLALGDRVDVSAPQSDGTQPGAPTSFRIVGIATFPPVSQIGTDQPRLGTGALISRRALDRLVGSDANDPEWTAVRLARGASPAAVIARLPDGVPEATGAPTSWYLDAKPAELRQLDGVAPLLYGAVAIGVLITFGAVVHGLWSQTRANRRDLAILGAIGFTTRQRGRAAAWQAVPMAAAVLVIGIPIGIAIGRLTYTRFARSLAVDDQFAIPAVVPVLLVAGTVLALITATIVAATVARRARLVPLLRSE